ncbi:MAG: NAD-dependent epimerase/dehydratase family protein [Opitutales bacterium]|nr:NAD-dependent epimerase/dehydratase family protein [Opitutales bacterium]
MANERVLLTGANGKIGKALLNSLLDKGYEVSCLTRKSRARSDIREIIGDLTDTPSLEQLTEGIDIVVHLAGITHTNNQTLYDEINVRGTQNLLRVCEKSGVRKFIYFGSRADNPRGGAYSLSKFNATNEVIKSGCPFIILKPAEVYGVDEEGLSLINSIVLNYPLVIPFPLTQKATLAPVHAKDVVRATMEVIRNPELVNQTYVLAGPRTYTIKELTRLGMKKHQVKKALLPVPLFLLRLAAALQSYSSTPALYKDQIDRLISEKTTDISAAEKDFGFSPDPLEEHLKSVFPAKQS